MKNLNESEISSVNGAFFAGIYSNSFGEQVIETTRFQTRQIAPLSVASSTNPSRSFGPLPTLQAYFAQSLGL